MPIKQGNITPNNMKGARGGSSTATGLWADEVCAVAWQCEAGRSPTAKRQSRLKWDLRKVSELLLSETVICTVFTVVLQDLKRRRDLTCSSFHVHMRRLRFHMCKQVEILSKTRAALQGNKQGLMSACLRRFCLEPSTTTVFFPPPSCRNVYLDFQLSSLLFVKFKMCQLGREWKPERNYLIWCRI